MHTSNLANAQFMQPGSAVFEIIQRNWFWHGLDRSFQVRPRRSPGVARWRMATCLPCIALRGGWATGRGRTL